MRFEDAWLDLLPVLKRLDYLLADALDALESNADAADLVLASAAADVHSLREEFKRAPGSPRFEAFDNNLGPCEGRLAAIVEAFDLSDFDTAVLVLALAPELDRRYARAYGLLHDDLSQKAPTVSLALDLFCDSAAAALECRLRFAASAPLFARGLLRSTADKSSSSLLEIAFSLEPEVARFLLGDGELTTLMKALADRGNGLEQLARRLPATQGWDDIVLTPNATELLREVCAQVRHRPRVLGDWGFSAKLALGRGTSALFAGPSGTGKTMAAGIIANELALPLYRIDLAQVVNKYIGETEKNLDRIFNAAQAANAILFFDEADALFGKRSETKDAHDRYANIEVGYLLQKMEEYEGLAILATNLRQNLDEAFVRRLSFIIEFPFPDELHRRQIWSVLFPPEAPLGDDIDFDWLAREVRMTGGHLRNISVAAAFIAAAEGGVIGRRHIALAVKREHQKLGKQWSAGE